MSSSFLNALIVAAGALRVNVLRSVLTMLGIVIGVGAVIVMVALGMGARELIGDRIRSMGTNLILVIPGASKQGGVHMGSGTVHTLTARDCEAISKNCVSVTAAAPNWGQVTQIVYGNRNWRARVSGTTVDFFVVREWNILTGRIFNAQEERAGSKVCVIGTTVANQLMGGTDAAGKIIRIQNVPFQVVGVLEAKGQSPGGEDQDDAVYVPLAAAHSRLFGTPFKDEVRVIIVQAESQEFLPRAQEEITELLAKRHRIAPGADNDFTVKSLTDVMRASEESLKVMTTLLGSIAAISLLVGGIGVMNIMLVSVTERTREIGIRMAVGAKTLDILGQFLVEACVLTMLGGITGIVFGIASSYVFAQVSNWPVLVSPISVAAAFGVSAAVGIFFGFFPAFKASRLNPIDALRYE
ncbi:ABC transporter permease [Desulfomonile tiedjei]|uniref:ABC-type antimicrobial peptide transport system, permease component n=1 Tax=Desulfomonile tiedjei (strain ATCC 49306 / DSM 6799 / DCB-1) TaxID=706587 RepID=I4CER5_DESTA|nr:ABC transporter permease [Desulfomonile tiedjei]AFM28056.1 ABC-type antimicrobial peptide transport system, permease component [Desulfomonile tiedjei DSM 6799]